MARAVGDATVVHKDDVAWNHGFFDWDGLLVGGVLEPLARGEVVAYRPPAWDEYQREGRSRYRPGSRWSLSRAWERRVGN